MQEIQQKIIVNLRIIGLESCQNALEELSNQEREDKEAIIKFLSAKRGDLLIWLSKEDKSFRGDLLPERDKKSLETFLLCLKAKGQKIPKFLFQKSIAPRAILDKEDRNQKEILCINYLREKYIPTFKSEIGKNCDNEKVEKLFDGFLKQIKKSGLMEKMIDNFNNTKN